MGAGLLAPIVVTGLQFGGEDGTVQTDFGPRPTPTRYTMIKQEVKFALGPSVGVAYRFIPEISVGDDRAGRDAQGRSDRGAEPGERHAAFHRRAGRLEASDYFIPVTHLLGAHAPDQAAPPGDRVPLGR